MERLITKQDEYRRNLRLECLKKNSQNRDKSKNSKPEYLIDIQRYHKRKELLEQKQKFQRKKELSSYFEENWKQWIPVYGIYDKITNMNDEKLDKYTSLKEYFNYKKESLAILIPWVIYQKIALNSLYKIFLS